MNIFMVDQDPIEAAKSLCDQHVVKMIVESCQLLSTAHRVLDGSIKVVDKMTKDGTIKPTKAFVLADAREDMIYKATHINHPSAIWCRTSVENYNWLVDHLFGLLTEYTYRYDKKHKAYICGLLYTLQCPPYNLKNYEFTTPLLAMPDEFKSSDFVKSYREFYNNKQFMYRYKRRLPPEWLNHARYVYNGSAV